jgi:hypothetical protein
MKQQLKKNLRYLESQGLLVLHFVHFTATTYPFFVLAKEYQLISRESNFKRDCWQSKEAWQSYLCVITSEAW